MKHGKLQHISQLVSGDVVRLTRGRSVPVEQDASQRSFEHKLADAVNDGVIPQIGGNDDCREGYDVMTVVATDENGTVTFQRPYIHVSDEDEQRHNTVNVSVEIVQAQRTHGGVWFELLGDGPSRKRKVTASSA